MVSAEEPVDWSRSRSAVARRHHQRRNTWQAPLHQGQQSTEAWFHVLHLWLECRGNAHPLMDEWMHGKMFVATAAAHEKILMWHMSTWCWWIMTV